MIGDKKIDKKRKSIEEETENKERKRESTD